MTTPLPARRRLDLLPLDQRYGLGGKVIGVANAGPRIRVGIALPDFLYHLHVLGPTGTGKTSLLLHLALDDATHGRGIAVLDPAKGDLIRDLLDRLPAACGRRLVVVDPDETIAPPAINLLDPAVHGGTPHDVAANLTTVMARVWRRWWGDRMTEITYHGLLTLAHLPGATLAQLPRLLSDPAWRTARVEAALSAVDPWEAASLREFWDGFAQVPAAARMGMVAPLLARLRLVLAHPLVQSLFGVPASTFSFADILDGGILLCRLPKGVLGEDGTRLVGSLLLAGLWQATTARARLPEAARPHASIVLDEAHNFLHLPIGLDDALAESRGLHVGWVLAHQYLGQLSTEMAAAIDANCRNKTYFSLAPDDAARQARHLRPYLDEGDLIRLGGFEVVLRPVAQGRTVPPVTASTEAPPPVVKGRAIVLRAAARATSGLDRKQRRRLRGDAAAPPTAHTSTSTIPAANLPAGTGGVPVGVGRNTFVFNGEDSLENSNEPPNEESNDPEPSGQHSPLNRPNRHLDGGESGWWTGTD